MSSDSEGSESDTLPGELLDNEGETSETDEDEIDVESSEEISEFETIENKEQTVNFINLESVKNFEVENPKIQIVFKMDTFKDKIIRAIKLNDPDPNRIKKIEGMPGGMARYLHNEAEIFKKQAFEKLKKKLKNVESLAIPHSELDLKDLSMLLGALGPNTNLKSLDLQFNSFTVISQNQLKISFSELSNFLNAHPAITFLNLSGTSFTAVFESNKFFSGLQHIKEIVLQQTFTEDEKEMDTFVDAIDGIASNQFALESIDLSFNKLNSLVRAKSLNSMLLKNPRIEELYLSGCELNSKLLLEIFSGVSTNVAFLDVSDNNLTGENIGTHIMNANTKLEGLNISNSKLVDEPFFAEKISQHRNVVAFNIDISRNKLSLNETLEGFYEAAKSNPAFKNLYISGNQFNVQEFKIFMKKYNLIVEKNVPVDPEFQIQRNLISDFISSFKNANPNAKQSHVVHGATNVIQTMKQASLIPSSSDFVSYQNTDIIAPSDDPLVLPPGQLATRTPNRGDKTKKVNLNNLPAKYLESEALFICSKCGSELEAPDANVLKTIKNPATAKFICRDH